PPEGVEAGAVGDPEQPAVAGHTITGPTARRTRQAGLRRRGSPGIRRSEGMPWRRPPGSGGEALATLEAAGPEHRPASLVGHPVPEAVAPGATEVVGLIGALHCVLADLGMTGGGRGGGPMAGGDRSCALQARRRASTRAVFGQR